MAGRRSELIVTDLNLAGKRDGGLQVMAAAGLLSTDAPIIVLTAFPDASNRSASHRSGATYFREKAGRPRCHRDAGDASRRPDDDRIGARSAVRGPWCEEWNPTF